MKKSEYHHANTKHIAFVGRLETEKGIDIAQEIIEASENRADAFVYHIFGEGSYFSYFSNFSENRVKLYGNIPQSILFSHIKKMDAVLMPSRFLETFGMVALEALSA